MSDEQPKKRSMSRAYAEAAQGKLGARKKNTVHVSASSSSSSSSDEEDIDLRDEAIGAEIEDHEASRPTKKKKVKASRRKTPKAKRSVVYNLFSRAKDQEGVWLCNLHEFMEPGEKHPQEVSQTGKQTSNLLAHCQRYHSEILRGLIKARNEGRDVEQEYAGLRAAMTPPKPRGMGLFVSITKRSEVLLRRQLSLLVFLVSNQVPFYVVESEQFTTWMKSLGIEYPSSETLKKLLSPLHEVVLTQLENSIIKAGFFSTTFDLWTSNGGNQYCVVTYHSMDEDFNFISSPLDLIPMDCSSFGEFIYISVQSRIRTHRFNDCLHAASFSDSGSNVVLAKSYLTPGDAEPCFNHDLKHVIEDVLVGTDSAPALCSKAAKDCVALALLVSFIRASGELTSRLSRIMRDEGSTKQKLIPLNTTRWESRFSSMVRAVDMRSGLKRLQELKLLAPLLEKHNVFPSDFLSASFWDRVNLIYLPFLRVCHVASKVAQRSKTPALSCIPFQIDLIEAACATTPDEWNLAFDFKNACAISVRRRLHKYVEVKIQNDEIVVPNAIKAAVLDPRYSDFAQQKLGMKLKDVCDAVVADSLHLFPKESPLDLIQQNMDLAFPNLLQKLRTAKEHAEITEDQVLPWWRSIFADDAQKGSLLQNFKHSVRLFLSMPAGGAPSEVAFSDTTGTVTKKRNQIGHQTLEQVTIVRHFIKSDKFNFEKVMEYVKDHVEKAQESHGDFSSGGDSE